VGLGALKEKVVDIFCANIDLSGERFTIEAVFKRGTKFTIIGSYFDSHIVQVVFDLDKNKYEFTAFTELYNLEGDI